jgi:hypothetical protein
LGRCAAADARAFIGEQAQQRIEAGDVDDVEAGFTDRLRGRSPPKAGQGAPDQSGETDSWVWSYDRQRARPLTSPPPALTMSFQRPPTLMIDTRSPLPLKSPATMVR